MKTPDVLREFDERFLMEQDFVYGGGPAIGNVPNRVTHKILKQDIVGLKAFIQEKLNERGEMIAREIEDKKKLATVLTDSLRKPFKDVLNLAAKVARSYKE